MPEGHTIHRLARDLNRDLKGTPLNASSPQGRFSDSAALFDGAEMTRAEAWGKHLFLRFAGGLADDETLHIHLGLIGKFRPKASPPPDPQGAIRLRLFNDIATWDLTGPTTCRLIHPDTYGQVIDKLGPDPLRRGASADRFVERLTRKRVAVGAALLDQSVIAGIGNVYRSEFCFLSGIDPSRPANQIAPDEAHALWDLSVAQLRRGVRLNRIVTRDEEEYGAKAGRIPQGERTYAYKRAGKPCRRCATPIARIVVGGRKMWFCPSCQPN